MAIDKTKLTGVEKVYPLNVSPYEQYMGDFQNPSVVSKVNAMIQSLHQIGRLTNETVSQWNNVMRWIVEGGMDEIAENITNEKVSVALEEVMRMLDVSLDNGLKDLAENVTDKKIDEMLESGHFESMVQTSLVELNEVVENKLDGFTLQLANKANDNEVRKKEVKLELEDASPTLLSAIEGGENTSFNLLSIPQDGSVSEVKMDDKYKGQFGSINLFYDPFFKRTNWTDEFQYFKPIPAPISSLTIENNGLILTKRETGVTTATWDFDIRNPFLPLKVGDKISCGFKIPTTSTKYTLGLRFYTADNSMIGTNIAFENTGKVENVEIPLNTSIIRLFVQVSTGTPNLEGMTMRAEYPVLSKGSRLSECNDIHTNVVNNEIDLATNKTKVENLENEIQNLGNPITSKAETFLKTKLAKPVGFLWDAPINIYKTKDGYATDLNPNDYKILNGGKTYYVDSVTGLANNSGLDKDSPLLTIQSALDKVDVETVVLLSKQYNLSTTLALKRACNVISEVGSTITTTQTINSLLSTAGYSLYVENITFDKGGSNLSSASPNNTAVTFAKDCKFTNSQSNDSVNILGGKLAVFLNCEASNSYGDGFNYHIREGFIPNGIEVNCIGVDNGGNNPNIDNGSTQHDGGKIVRVNCIYGRNAGSNVGDINVGTQSWNVGCEAFQSEAETGNRYKSNFTAHAGAEMWNEGCKSYGSPNASLTQDNAKMFSRNTYYEGERVVEGTGANSFY